MRVDDADGGFFLGHVLQRSNQNSVLEHVGVVTGVKAVAVAEHRS